MIRIRPAGKITVMVILIPLIIAAGVWMDKQPRPTREDCYRSCRATCNGESAVQTWWF